MTLDRIDPMLDPSYDDIDLDDDMFEEEDDDEEEQLTAQQRLEEVFRPMLHELSLEKAVVFHGITLLLCCKLLFGQRFDKYHKAVVEAVKTIKRNSSLNRKEQEVAHAEEVLLKLKRNILNKIQENIAHGRRSLGHEGYFMTSTDIALRYVSSSLTSEQITNLIKGIVRYRNGVNGNRELDHLAFVFFQCAREEHDNYCWDTNEFFGLDEDWIDEADKEDFDIEEWEYDDEEFAEQLQKYDPEELERVMDERHEAAEKYIHDFSLRLQSLSDEWAIVFHATVINLMMRIVRPKIYAKYWLMTRDLIREYIADKNSKSFREAHKEADELLERKMWILKRYPEYNATVDRIGEFNLLATSIEKCFDILSESDKERIEGMISDFVFNEITNDYSSNMIDNFAADCIEMAKECIIR